MSNVHKWSKQIDTISQGYNEIKVLSGILEGHIQHLQYEIDTLYSELKEESNNDFLDKVAKRKAGGHDKLKNLLKKPD